MWEGNVVVWCSRRCYGVVVCGGGVVYGGGVV